MPQATHRRPARSVAALTALLLALAAPGPAYPKAAQTVKLAYFGQRQPPPAALPYLEPVPADRGQAGAALAVADNNTTGAFTGQKFVLKPVIAAEGEDIAKRFLAEVAGKFAFVVLNLPADKLLEVARLPQAANLLLFDAATSDDRLRNGDCQPNVLHLLPSRSMRADALGQYLAKKRWTRWFLVVGNTAEDRLFAEAVRRAGKRYHANIIQQKTWEHSYEDRRTAQADVAVFTQTDGDYDVLVVADERAEFGDYLEYQTWLPRPVVGTQGLVATAWHRTHEHWGAIQMQRRFKEHAGRWMDEQDYAAYLAVRAVGEAATRTRSADPGQIKAYLTGGSLALQGYKGSPLSFRPWDGQLRQPVLLAASRAQVAVAPIEGFLHPRTELDTLGHDQPETQCHRSTP